MEKLSRREFVRRTSAAGFLLSAGAASPLTTSGRKLRSATDAVVLGKTGIEASFLAFGTGVNGYSQSSAITRMGLGRGAALLRYGVDHGISFIDAADLYGSHQIIPDALEGIPRERYALLTKIWPRRVDWYSYSGGAKAEVDRFRRELKTDVIDVCLLHCLLNSQWPDENKRAMDELSELKARGVVTAVGVSCHDFGAMEVAAEHPWVDLLLARINNRGGRQFSMDGTVREVSDVLRTARAHGKAVVGMKIYGEGKLSDPEQMNASLRYVLDEGLVDAVTIGMVRREEVDDNIQRITAALSAK